MLKFYFRFRFNLPIVIGISFFIHPNPKTTVLRLKNVIWAIYIESASSFECSLDAAKRSFYRAFNAILGKVWRIATNEVIIQLIKTKCFPVLYYGLQICPLRKSHYNLMVTSLIAHYILHESYRRRRKMYCGHARLCVCVCVCLSVCLCEAVRPHYCTDPDVTWGRGRGCPLVVHYWADLQSGHGLRCYGNITRTLVTSLRPSRDMTT